MGIVRIVITGDFPLSPNIHTCISYLFPEDDIDKNVESGDNTDLSHII